MVRRLRFSTLVAFVLAVSSVDCSGVALRIVHASVSR
jgi:hypothetical protein